MAIAVLMAASLGTGMFVYAKVIPNSSTSNTENDQEYEEGNIKIDDETEEDELNLEDTEDQEEMTEEIHIRVGETAELPIEEDCKWISEDEYTAQTETVDGGDVVVGVSEGITDIVGYVNNIEKIRYTVIVSEKDYEKMDKEIVSDFVSTKTIVLSVGESEDLPTGWSESYSENYSPDFNSKNGFGINGKTGFVNGTRSEEWTSSGLYEWKSEDEDIAETKTVDGRSSVIGVSEGDVDIVGYTNGAEKARYTIIVKNDEDDNT